MEGFTEEVTAKIWWYRKLKLRKVAALIFRSCDFQNIFLSRAGPNYNTAGAGLTHQIVKHNNAEWWNI